ncbi:MAG TPA: FadR/GntR family transcriptional regulator [Ideonella sp.]|nr:FadR/GntR family transcriptional regulator [Ideonella sp.]
MPTPPAETRRLYRQIAEQISRLIESGEAGIGARLPSERDLAERLGVSRPSVREAIIALEVEGAVEVRGGAGVFVLERRPAPREPLPQHTPGPFDVIRARWIIESEAAALAAQQAKAEHLQRLKLALREMREHPNHTSEGIAADQRFHLCIAEASGNAALLMVVQQLWEQRTGPLYLQLESHFSGRTIWREAVTEHEALLDAIASREPDAAREAMRLHMKNAELRFASNWKSQDTPAG